MQLRLQGESGWNVINEPRDFAFTSASVGVEFGGANGSPIILDVSVKQEACPP